MQEPVNLHHGLVVHGTDLIYVNPVPRAHALGFALWCNLSVETTHLSHGQYSTGLQGVRNIYLRAAEPGVLWYGVKACPKKP